MDERKKYVSAYERLAQMPPAFTLNTLMRWTGMSRAAAKVTASRWAAKGLVEMAGPRASLYFNRVADPHGQQASPATAAMMTYPSATLCGASVLHAAGWTTQIPSCLHVAIEERRSYTRINGVIFWPRPVEWFQEMQHRGAWYSDQDAGPAMPTFGLRALKPAWALADVFAGAAAGQLDSSVSSRPWCPDEDDLDIPEGAIDEVHMACEALGVRLPWDEEEFSRERVLGQS